LEVNEKLLPLHSPNEGIGIKKSSEGEKFIKRVRARGLRLIKKY
jgi:hypothetical protein